MASDSALILPNDIMSRISAEITDASASNINNSADIPNQMPNERRTTIEDDTSELIVLDPSHPLMSRFQNSLKAMLMKHLEKAEVIMREKNEEFKREKAAHIETGCELYNFQQELAKFQVQLEKKHEEYKSIKEASENAQQNLKELREVYHDCVQGLNEDTKSMHRMREEVDSLSLRLFYLSRAREDVMSDIRVMKRAADKATIDLSKYEDDKLRQDMLVDRIQTKVDQLKEDIALYDAQITAQEAEMSISQNLLHEAEAQIVAITTDRKHLMAQWNSSLLGLQRRNEAYASLLNAYNELKDRLLVLDNEQVAYRRSISAEQEKHEGLTMLVNKNEADLNTVKRRILQQQTKHEADKQAYATYTRMRQETERNLANVQAELSSCQSAVDTIRKQIEKEAAKKTELDAKISAELRDRLIAKKAMEYVKKLDLKVQDQSRELLTQIAQLENEIARDELAAAVKKSENERLKQRIQEVEDEIKEQNASINKVEVEIHRASVMVERKQSAIDLLNKKLEGLLRETGGQELGPLEVMINTLTKTVQAKQEEIGELEQQWLKEQSELVKYVNDKDNLTKTAERLQKQLTILAQKKLRIDNEIAIQEREKAELQRELKHLQNDTTRLNVLIAKEKCAGENLSNENRLAETDFVRALREKETEVVELQGKVDGLRSAREDMLNELVETERTIMLWEKKVQLCEETRHAVDCDLGQGELNVMRSEIHRMEVRKNSLLQQQEKLLQALERSVAKRDTIVLQSESVRTQQSKAKIRINAQRQLDELKKKLKATKQLIKTCDTETKEMEAKVKSLEEEIMAKRLEFEGEQKSVDELSAKLQSLLEERHKYVFDVQMKQHETVYWEQVRDGRYKRLCPSSTSQAAETTRQLNRIRTLLMLIDRLVQEFPQINPDLLPVQRILENRLQAEDEKEFLEIAPQSVKKDTRRRSRMINEEAGPSKE